MVTGGSSLVLKYDDHSEKEVNDEDEDEDDKEDDDQEMVNPVNQYDNEYIYMMAHIC